MNDNLIIESMEFTDEMYQKVLKENLFKEDDIHGIGDEFDGNS